MNNQIQTCKCGCFVFDAECKKCVMCGAERPGTNNPQDNASKGESVREMKIHEVLELYVHESRFDECSPQTKSTLYRGFYDGYENAQSRIAELEKQNSELREVCKRYKTALLLCRPMVKGTAFELINNELNRVENYISEQALNSKDK